ncbi:MAG: nucleoside deaminase [Thermoguttaceae bacterium]
MNPFMKLAIEAAREGMQNGCGGPFGAVVVKNGQVVSIACNEVLSTNDPTAHAEIVALRRATQKLGTFMIPDCEMYATCEPCMMCLTAMYFAGITKLYYGADRNDSVIGGFDATCCYELAHETLNHPLLTNYQIVDAEECVSLFHEWAEKSDRIMYGVSDMDLY